MSFVVVFVGVALRAVQEAQDALFVDICLRLQKCSGLLAAKFAGQLEPL